MLRFLLSLLLLGPLSLSAQPVTPPGVTAPAIAARSWILHDYTTGQTLAEHDALLRVEPASLTKLMTAYLVYAALNQEKIRPEQKVRVSERAWRIEGSRMFVEPNRPVSVDQLLRGLVIQSGNDASVALAELVAGSEEAFVAAMNREAQRLGMKDTHFANVTGLPHPQHYSTARDLAVLATALIRDFPDFYPLHAQREYRYNNISQANRNRLLWSDATVDGIKTGYTENAGYCLISSALRGERRVVAVVLGAASESARAAESQKLLNFAFQAFDAVRLYGPDQDVTSIRVWKGSARQVRAGFPGGLSVALPAGGREKLRATVDSLQPLLAPVHAGQRVATLRLAFDGKPYGQYAVVALEEVPLAGPFGRAWDALRLFFQ